MSPDAATVSAELLAHVTRALGPYLPTPLTVIAAADTVMLTSNRSGQAIATHGVVPPPATDPETIRIHAHHVLADIQDLVVTHLHTPWPLGSGGGPTSVRTSLSGRAVRLAFAGSSGEITLPDFEVPGSGPVRTAG